ncbi:hypothetical protein LIA77_08550 [Sarocladium implicatum]|nr:hypothetical protein LIA77_08550 [Sarocladium implicatum]
MDCRREQPQRGKPHLLLSCSVDSPPIAVLMLRWLRADQSTAGAQTGQFLAWQTGFTERQLAHVTGPSLQLDVVPCMSRCAYFPSAASAATLRHHVAGTCSTPCPRLCLYLCLCLCLSTRPPIVPDRSDRYHWSRCSAGNHEPLPIITPSLQPQELNSVQYRLFRFSPWGSQLPGNGPRRPSRDSLSSPLVGPSAEVYHHRCYSSHCPRRALVSGPHTRSLLPFPPHQTAYPQVSTGRSISISSVVVKDAVLLKPDPSHEVVMRNTVGSHNLRCGPIDGPRPTVSSTDCPSLPAASLSTPAGADIG